ncbi:hypothetical protein ACIRD2_34035, partial [Streptomyces sp. NPDC093595]|uniref:hypothetical protein n=1 Tax=Streptomyces sp. NPDC093595 TaxID=3366045 RepID=UPI00382641D1
MLLVTAGTISCDCRWYLELDWSSPGRKGTVRIDDDGHPFRTSAIKGLLQYTCDTLERRWEPYSYLILSLVGWGWWVDGEAGVGEEGPGQLRVGVDP